MSHYRLIGCYGQEGPGPDLLRAGGAAVDPEFHLGNGGCPGEWRRRAAIAGTPAPADKVIRRNVLEELF
jgi:hypothetical protein